MLHRIFCCCSLPALPSCVDTFIATNCTIFRLFSSHIPFLGGEWYEWRQWSELRTTVRKRPRRIFSYRINDGSGELWGESNVWWKWISIYLTISHQLPRLNASESKSSIREEKWNKKVAKMRKKAKESRKWSNENRHKSKPILYHLIAQITKSFSISVRVSPFAGHSVCR